MKLVKTKQLQEIGTSHDETIKKKVFIGKDEIPQLMMFGSAVFLPGQKVEAHVHATMYEVFYIQKGRIDFVIDDKKITVSEGDCITVEAGEVHSQHNNYNQEVSWIYFGIATD
ncbi:cupin domain-containing protein [Ochrovirga pacifica]|uniref:cupin domain-containing protein n=1 Tax=Ochrovirga pacifica TaxID=1042376 RepID=UPI000255A03A|nr:cupin domain-containing protein [Ochrovirga pacifica]